MTPEQEEAERLIELFRPYANDITQYDEDMGMTPSLKEETKNAKACAAIHCRGVIDVLKKLRKPEYTTFIEWEQLKEKDVADTWDGYEYIDHWNKVLELLTNK